MLRSFAYSCVVSIVIVSGAIAAGPFGTIHIGGWSGGAYTDDKTGAFSHCAASAGYANGITVIVGQNANASWLIGSRALHFI